ncbi:MAG: DNA polymerase III subunit gamma/tau, partial [Gammaproteobacteria bacterium]|nr:DNA polymerase III subunit gamma/tau [Gammaproteobacteria bacterium]
AQQLALNCQYRQREANTLHLELDTAHAHLATEQLIQRLQEAIARHYGEPLKIRIQAVHADLDTPAKRDARRQAENLQAAQAVIAADPNVRNLCETFGAQVNPELVKLTE